MVGFRRKKISNLPCLGEQLKNRREELKVILSEAAKQISVSRNYLQALEEGQYEKLPGEVYIRNFLKVYAKFLNLDCQQILDCYQSEKRIYNIIRHNKVNDFKKPVERVSQFHFIATPKVIKGIVVGILAICCLIYLGVKVKGIMEPPFLAVASPADNLNTSQNFVEVRGEVELEAVLEINGQQVLAEQDGSFRETIDLLPGVNIIEIRAEKRHGKETTIYRQIVVTINEDN